MPFIFFVIVISTIIVDKTIVSRTQSVPYTECTPSIGTY